MIKVLHYDYDVNLAVELQVYLTEYADQHPEVNYEFLEHGGYGDFKHDRKTIESRLPEIDVQLIKPGIKGRRVVIHQYPTEFPHLKIGLLTPSPDMYEESGEVQVLDYLNIDQIVNFILSCKKEIIILPDT